MNYLRQKLESYRVNRRRRLEIAQKAQEILNQEKRTFINRF